jgi:hypothetical protein
MGCVSSSPDSPLPHADSPHSDSVADGKGLVRKFTITVSANAATEDINITKIGSHFVIQGTKAVVDIQQCNVIGYLDEGNVFHNDKSEYIVSICKKFDVEFVPQ